MSARTPSWPPTAVSHVIHVDGPLHYLDFGGPPDAPVMLCVHGLGGSALNWGIVAPLLTGSYRVLAVDLVGHGRTRPHGGGDVIEANLRLLDGFTAVINQPVILLGHSMGGVLALLYAQRSPRAVDRMVLLSPPLPRPTHWPLDAPLAVKRALLSTPGVRWTVARTQQGKTPEQQVDRQLRNATPYVSRIPSEGISAVIDETRERGNNPSAATAQATQWKSILAVMAVLVRVRSFRRRLRTLSVPVLWLQGTDDPFVSIGTARHFAAIRPDWRFETREHTGHLPHLECPEWVARETHAWLTETLV